jgi:hypothetical protein
LTLKGGQLKKTSQLSPLFNKLTRRYREDFATFKRATARAKASSARI